MFQRSAPVSESLSLSFWLSFSYSFVNSVLERSGVHMHNPDILKWFLYSFLCVTADVLDAIISIFRSAKRPEVS